MCTVTLIPFIREESFVLTSSRDEAPARDTLAPDLYKDYGIRMIYPKDVVAGGTWLGVSQRKRLICLLNGAFEPHDRNPPYKKSRGVVVKELLAQREKRIQMDRVDLEGVEPFTIIVAEWMEELHFQEVVWDGVRTYCKSVVPDRPHIWSSSPLYSPEVRTQREDWFKNFLSEHPASAENLLNFHQKAGEGDLKNAIRMDRGFVRTRSISQIGFSGGKFFFYYRDLESGMITKKILSKDFFAS